MTTVITRMIFADDINAISNMPSLINLANLHPVYAILTLQQSTDLSRVEVSRDQQRIVFDPL
jgi:hypothetical protein